MFGLEECLERCEGCTSGSDSSDVPVGRWCCCGQGFGPKGSGSVPVKALGVRQHWLFSEGIFQQEGAQIGDGATFVFRSAQQGFVNVIAQCDRDSTGLALKHAKTVVHW